MGNRISDEELRLLLAEVHARPLKAAKAAGQIRAQETLVADVYGFGPGCDSYAEMTELLALAPALAAEVLQLREALAWYGEQARLARLIHSGGDAGRHALQDDGGKRANAALTGGHSNG